jgi:hypothetical protein
MRRLGSVAAPVPGSTGCVPRRVAEAHGKPADDRLPPEQRRCCPTCAKKRQSSGLVATTMDFFTAGSDPSTRYAESLSQRAGPMRLVARTVLVPGLLPCDGERDQQSDATPPPAPPPAGARSHPRAVRVAAPSWPPPRPGLPPGTARAGYLSPSGR